MWLKICWWFFKFYMQNKLHIIFVKEFTYLWNIFRRGLFGNQQITMADGNRLIIILTIFDNDIRLITMITINGDQCIYLYVYTDQKSNSFDQRTVGFLSIVSPGESNNYRIKITNDDRCETYNWKKNLLRQHTWPLLGRTAAIVPLELSFIVGF